MNIDQPIPHHPQIAPSKRGEYEDEQGRIWKPVVLTPYDKRRMELRDVEAERDALLAKEPLTARDEQLLAVLNYKVARAQERFDQAIEFADSERGRAIYRINDWRRNEGREEYNAKRRKVRLRANASLHRMTDEQKLQHRRDQKADAKWKKEQLAKGISDTDLEAAFAERLERRARKRVAETNSAAGSTE